ncbi:MAG: hypothetical protein KAG37_07445 [Flavobacteriales bacterium]|nr:hypothetical protein [Flavobacteriales bacterium]
MKRITTLLLLIFLTQTSCDIIRDDCKDIVCTSPPPTFRFEFIDKENSENLFTNKTIKIEDVEVYDEVGKGVRFNLITENDINVLDISEIGWTMGPKSYTIELSEDTSVDITLNMKAKNSECCSYFEVVEFYVLEYGYERSKETGFIVVKL